jgi:hypothetical protein
VAYLLLFTLTLSCVSWESGHVQWRCMIFEMREVRWLSGETSWCGLCCVEMISGAKAGFQIVLITNMLCRKAAGNAARLRMKKQHSDKKKSRKGDF